MRDFDSFDPKKIGVSFNSDKTGFFFSSDRDTASGYAEWVASGGRPEQNGVTGANVLPVFVNLRNPLTLQRFQEITNGLGLRQRHGRGVDALTRFFDEERDLLIRYAKQEKHDGILLEKDGIHLVVAFRPEQIKSALGNNGNFDPNDPRIQFGQARAASQHDPRPVAGPAAKQTEGEAFGQWFGGSKVVDGQGKPLVVYHGTGADIEAFDPSRAGGNYLRGGRRGIFFTNRPIPAGVYAEQASAANFADESNPHFGTGTATVMPVFLSLQSPYVRKATGSPDKWFDSNQSKLYLAAEKAGADGIIVHGGNGFENRSIYVAFRPEQIKSAIGNTGRFDPNDPRIQFGQARAASQHDPRPVAGPAAKQTEGEAFGRWFGDSKIVDEQGKPLVVYHGTKADFSEFDSRKSGTSDDGLVGKGFYFTYNPEEASGYAESEMFGDGQAPNVQPVYVAVTNPLRIVKGAIPDGRKVIDIHKAHGFGINAKGGAAIKKIAEDGGHDGVMWIRADGGVGHVVAFRPEQIKSAIGNNGRFDPNDPRIQFSLATASQAASDPLRDSRIVDDQGKPLMLYHGTRQVFDQFSADAPARGSMGESLGFYFTESPSVASEYADHDGHVVPVYLNIKNPLRIDARMINRDDMSALIGLDLSQVYGAPDRAEVYWFFKNGGAYDGRDEARVGSAVMAAVQAKGYDGVIFKERVNGELANVYMAFEPEQIISAIQHRATMAPTTSAGAARAQQEAALPVAEWLAGSKLVDAQGRPQVVYRGLGQAPSDDAQPAITWVTPDATYASQYARDNASTVLDGRRFYDTGATVLPLYARVRNSFDLGFRSTHEIVAYSDVLDRVESGVQSAYERDAISQPIAVTLMNEIDALRQQDVGAARKVHQWWRERADEIRSLLERAGYDAISSREGFDDRIQAYGIFRPEQLRSAIGHRAPAPDPRKQAFDRWFAKSQVIDATGKPQVMFHASYKDFSVFDRTHSSQFRPESADTIGSWFSDTPGAGGADMYAQGTGAAIYPVYLNIQRPKVYTTFRDFLQDMHSANGQPDQGGGLGSTQALRETLKAQGYDGIAFQRTENGALQQEIDELSASIDATHEEYRQAARAAREAGLEMTRTEGMPYQAKIDRLNARRQMLAKELAAFGGSTEFDNQYVWVAFEPEQIKSAIEGFDNWFAGSYVVDESGAPQVVYRGEHGPSDAVFNSRLGSLSFGSFETARLYATVPNDHRDVAEHPRVTPAYLAIKCPLTCNLDADPFIDFSVLSAALGEAQARAIALDLQDAIYETQAWLDLAAEGYTSLADALEHDRHSLSRLYVEAYRVFDDHAYVAQIRAAGFDGAIYGGSGANSGELEYRVLSPEQVQCGATLPLTVAPTNWQGSHARFHTQFNDATLAMQRRAPSGPEVPGLLVSDRHIRFHLGLKGLDRENRFEGRALTPAHIGALINRDGTPRPLVQFLQAHRRALAAGADVERLVQQHTQALRTQLGEAEQHLDAALRGEPTALSATGYMTQVSELKSGLGWFITHADQFQHQRAGATPAMLDWQRPLTEQPADVMSALALAGIDGFYAVVAGEHRETFLSKAEAQFQVKVMARDGFQASLLEGAAAGPAPSGREVFEQLSELVGGAEAASQLLRSSGIAGVRFESGASTIFPAAGATPYADQPRDLAHMTHQAGSHELTVQQSLSKIPGYAMAGDIEQVRQRLAGTAQLARQAAEERIKTLSERDAWLRKAPSSNVTVCAKNKEALQQARQHLQQLHGWRAPSVHNCLPWDGEIPQGVLQKVQQILPLNREDRLTGQAAFLLIAGRLGSPNKAAQALAKAGVIGAYSPSMTVAWDKATQVLAETIEERPGAAQLHLSTPEDAATAVPTTAHSAPDRDDQRPFRSIALG
ncbi:hypothetical protein SSTU70S_05524 [Stutzerimonas stutzeri]